MRVEATSAGFYEPESFPGWHCPKLRILTVQQLLEGAKIQYPAVASVGLRNFPERRDEEARGARTDVGGDEQGSATGRGKVGGGG